MFEATVSTPEQEAAHRENRKQKEARRRARNEGFRIFSEAEPEVGDTVVVTISKGRDPYTGVRRPIEITEGTIVAIHENYFLLNPVTNDETEQCFFKNLREVEIRN